MGKGGGESTAGLEPGASLPAWSRAWHCGRGSTEVWGGFFPQKMLTSTHAHRCPGGFVWLGSHQAFLGGDSIWGGTVGVAQLGWHSSDGNARWHIWGGTFRVEQLG